jgi:hypothetical protein
MSRFHSGDMNFIDKSLVVSNKFVSKLKPQAKVLKVTDANLRRYNEIAEKLSKRGSKITDKQLKFFNDFTKILEKS